MKKVGLLGGTFDPPHLGHLFIAEEVYQALGLDEVWFVPSFEPPHKEKANISAEERLAMLKAAISTNDHFAVNTIELNRQGKSYTLDTIRSLQEEHREVKFFFIIGADMVEYLPKWYKIDELMDRIQFVGVKRPEYQVRTKYPIIEVDIPSLEISSTLIRRRLFNNQSIKYLVPDEVLRVIKENHLYGTK